MMRSAASMTSAFTSRTAHVFGHTDFFKNNAYFQHTSRRMIDKVSIHAERIAKYEFDHGKAEVERFLDAGAGECWLRNERVAELVRNALLHFDRDRYKLLAWCIMPNRSTSFSASMIRR